MVHSKTVIRFKIIRLKLLQKHNGKDGKVAESYSVESKLYSDTDCSGNVIVDEKVTFKWVDYRTVTSYPCRSRKSP